MLEQMFIRKRAPTPKTTERPKKPPVPVFERPGKVTILRLIYRFVRYHYRGLVGLLTPIITIHKYTPAETNYDNIAMCGIIMIVYWVTECIPLQVTSFIPVALLPILHVMDTHPVCMCYLDDTIILYLAGIMLGSAIEFSGLARRIAIKSVQYVGITHWRLLFTVCFTTTFISMWITNTAATLIMMPIVYSILEVYDLQGDLEATEVTAKGDLVTSQLIVCYYSSITIAASIGGIGTLFGTATNFVGRALFVSEYPSAPELLTIHRFSFFSVPIMIPIIIFTYFYMAVLYMGMFRPLSKAREAIQLSGHALEHGKRVLRNTVQDLGPMTDYEYFVIMMIVFSMAVLSLRSPACFPGWADGLQKLLKLKTKYIMDSVAAIFICFLVILSPCPKKCRKLCGKRSSEGPQDKTEDEMKARRSGQQNRLLVTWDHMSGQLPWSYMFMLGGGIALATSCREEHSNMNEEIKKKIAKKLDTMGPAFKKNPVLLLIVIIATVFATNFASNVAVAIVAAIFVMNLAYYLRTNPLWYIIAVQFSASFGFMLPIGTPGNFIVYKKAKLPILSMMLAGLGPTIFSIIILWLAVILYAPLIWPILNETGLPVWVNRTD